MKLCDTCGATMKDGVFGTTCGECLRCIIANCLEDDGDPPVCIDCGEPVDPAITICVPCFKKDMPYEDEGSL